MNRAIFAFAALFYALAATLFPTPALVASPASAPAFSQTSVQAVAERPPAKKLRKPKRDKPRSHLTWEGWVVVFVIFGAFVMMVWEIFPPHIAMCFAAILLVVTQVVNFNHFAKGFIQTILLTLAMLCVVARTLEVNGIVKFITKSFLTRSRNRLWQMASIIGSTYLMSLVINPVPVVLILAPVIRQWAISQGYAPSKYLIPLSYASILGGTCTLMGSSTNLVVDSLLVRRDPMNGLGYFELGQVGLVSGVVGMLFVFFFSDRLMPKYPDVVKKLSHEAKEFTGEFLVTKDCPFVNQTIGAVARPYFHGATVIEIERNGVLIDVPRPTKKILEGDRLIFVGDVQQIGLLHKIPGLSSLNDPHFAVDETSLHFSEIVISTTSSLIGRTLRQYGWRSYYDATVLAIYRQGKRVAGRVGDVILQAGDTLMLLSSGYWKGSDGYHNDYYCVIHNEEVKETGPTRPKLILSVLGAMVVLAAVGVPLVWVSTAAALVFFFTKSISLEDASKGIYWNLLLLIASAFTVAYGLRKTGVVDFLADFLYSFAGGNPHLLVAGVFLVMLVLNEVITNNAAALLMFPVAIKAAKLNGFASPEAYKAMAATIALAASSSFITPVGYQNNLIVYGPGGYRFRDYAKMGVPLALIIFTVAVIMIPRVWPLTSTGTEMKAQAFQETLMKPAKKKSGASMVREMPFHDRHDAGRQLVGPLSHYEAKEGVIILGLPRGGVVNAVEVASRLSLPMDVICPRKLRAPKNPELAIGAVTESGKAFYDFKLLKTMKIDSDVLEKERLKQMNEAKARQAKFRKSRSPLSLEGQTAIIVDDGLATGFTMKAAIHSVKEMGATRVVVAVPVSPPDTAKEIKSLVDEFICLEVEPSFRAVGQFYEDFDEVTDDEVLQLMDLEGPH